MSKAANGTEIQRSTGSQDIARLVQSAESEYAKVIRDPAMVQRFMRVAITEFRLKPDLASCNPTSILASLMQAAQLGLEVGSAMRQGYLIPYKNECTFQPSYIGLLVLARRSGYYRDIDARLVNERDEFRFEYDPTPRLFHKPDLWNPGAMLGAYTFSTLANGESKFLAMNLDEIEKVRKQSKFPNGAPWTTWFSEKAKCSVLKRFLKTGDLSPELAEAIELEESEYKTATVRHVGQRALPAKGVTALVARLKGTDEVPAEPTLEDGQPESCEVEEIDTTEAGSRG